MKEHANLLDKRLIQKSLTNGLISLKEYDNYLKNLPDMEAESELLILDSEELEQEESASGDEDVESDSDNSSDSTSIES